MDTNSVWVGEHSPKIMLDATTPHGIQQDGLGLKTGKQYTGRVILAADPGADQRQPDLGPNPETVRPSLSNLSVMNMRRFP